MPAAAEPEIRPSATCGVGCHALVEARLSEIAALRDKPVPAAVPALPPRFLRHCDEHAVVAIHALLEAVSTLPAALLPLDAHAVVAAPCHAGRLITAKGLLAMRGGGAATVSPHIVPQCSLHSIAGAASVALGMHGPHLGVGGGSDALAEGLCAAISLAHDPGCGAPVVWLLATEWDAEPMLDAAGMPSGDPLCRGVAVAIEAGASRCGRSDRSSDRDAQERPLSLALHVAASAGPRSPEVARPVAAFASALDICRAGAALVAWSLPCPWGGEIRVQGRQAAASRATARLREAA